MQNNNRYHCQYLKKDGKFIWPMPEGAKDYKLTEAEVKKLLKWVLKRLNVKPEDFYSSCRKRELAQARSMISYMLFSMGVERRIIAKLLGKERSSIQNLCYFAIREWGEELEPIGGLIYAYELWRSERTDLNFYYQVKKSKRRGK